MKYAFCACVGVAALASPVLAVNHVLASDPFAGSTALSTPGRQIFGGGERTLASFGQSSDVFVLDASFFAVSTTLNFVNAPASGLSSSGLNVVVLNQADNDNNPQTAFLAGTAANLIAAAIDTPGAGFFVYSNSSLGVNRLVYSTDLRDPTADLAILARIASPIAPDAFPAMSGFGASNFIIVPAPAALTAFGACGVIGLRRRR
jgi:hypothetical protein